ncbi:MAG TPA: hypothetical protein GXZ87_05375 [Bacteroidales bacterium]|nr:hypothetical protein [Bacteroidales bacterium]
MKAKKLFMAFLAMGLLFTAYSCKEEDEPTVELKNQIMLNGEKFNITEGIAFLMGESAEFMFFLSDENHGMLNISSNLIGKKTDITTIKESNDENRQFFDFSFNEIYFASYELGGWTGWFKVEKKSDTTYNVSFEFKKSGKSEQSEQSIKANFDATVTKH